MVYKYGKDLLRKHRIENTAIDNVMNGDPRSCEATVTSIDKPQASRVCQ